MLSKNGHAMRARFFVWSIMPLRCRDEDDQMEQQTDPEITYEVEIRFRVPSAAAAFTKLPFLEGSLGPEKSWYTCILGRSIYDAGKLLRIGYVPPTGDSRMFLGYKGIDEGTFANIRQEWGEEITEGTTASTILANLGMTETFSSPKILLDHLATHGHTAFMDFSGVDRQGYVPALDVHTKLMRCPKILGNDVMVELELATTSLVEAHRAEQKLQQIATQYGITEQLIREEPPTLLYQVSFGSGASG